MTVSELVAHDRLSIDDKMFHVLATAFALSHQSLCGYGAEPDAIELVELNNLLGGIALPHAARMPIERNGRGQKGGIGKARYTRFPQRDTLMRVTWRKLVMAFFSLVRRGGVSSVQRGRRARHLFPVARC